MNRPLGSARADTSLPMTATVAPAAGASQPLYSSMPVTVPIGRDGRVVPREEWARSAGGAAPMANRITVVSTRCRRTGRSSYLDRAGGTPGLAAHRVGAFVVTGSGCRERRAAPLRTGWPQPRPGSVIHTGSRSLRASSGSSPPFSIVSSTMERPVRTDSFTISAASAYPRRVARAVARLTVRSA